MAYDPVHQQVVLFGGNAGTKILNDTWLWNGRDWLAAPAQTTPPATLTGAGLDYSASLGKMVLFSGLAWDALRVASVSLDAWSWDGGQWKKLPVTTFELISDFTKLTAAEATKGILGSAVSSCCAARLLLRMTELGRFPEDLSHPSR
jgi:hypothetical protein